MCTAAFTESFSLFLRRGRCPHRPLRKNPAPHKFPHITAKTRYFSTFPSKAKIPLFGFSHFSFRIMGQKCCFFVPSVNSADWNFTLCSHFTKLTCIICHRKIIVFYWLFLQYRLYLVITSRRTDNIAYIQRGSARISFMPAVKRPTLLSKLTNVSGQYWQILKTLV